jgi:hypothetical protein
MDGSFPLTSTDRQKTLAPLGRAVETLELVEELRHDLAAAPELVPVHAWQKEELARRKERLANDQAPEPCSVFAAGTNAHAIVAREAEQDLARACLWYERRRPGGGEQFRGFVDAGIRAICRVPQINPVVREDFRRALLRPFPFVLFYEYTSDKVTVFGLFHTAADPEKWSETFPERESAKGRVRRLPQTVLIVSVLVGSWLGMQLVHEFGHVLGAWVSGGRVARVVVHPLTISRTDLADNPHPLVVVWAGPIFGVLLPLAGWAAVVRLRLPAPYLLRFFAGFCLIANGAYIAGGSAARIGDAGEMLRHGSPIWLLWLFGLATVPAGLWLWHRQGMHFGLPPASGSVSVRAAYGALAGVVFLVILEVLLAWI